MPGKHPLSLRRRKLLGAALLGLSVGAVAATLALIAPRFIERGELWTYDMRAATVADPSRASDDIVLIDVAEADLSNVEELFGLTWPWPRALYGYIADYVLGAGAKAIAFDLIIMDRGIYGADDLEEFAATLDAGGRAVVGMVTSPIEANATKVDPPETNQQRWVATVATFEDRDAAVRAAARVLSWNVRAFIHGDGAVELSLGGATTQDQVFAAIERLQGSGDLSAIFGEQAAEPQMRVLTADIAAGEVTPQRLVAERALDVPTDGSVTLPHKLPAPPVPIVAALAPALGNVMHPSDFDGVMRQHAFFVDSPAGRFPSLIMAGYLLAEPDTEVRFADRHMVVGDAAIPVGQDGRAVLRFHGTDLYDHVSSHSVLRSVQQVAENQTPEISPSRFKDKYVIVAPTAHSLRDIRSSPVGREHPGAEINAQALDNLLSNDFIVRSSRAVDALISLVLAGIGALFVAGISRSTQRSIVSFAMTTVGAVAVLGGFIASTFVVLANGYWIPLFLPLTGAAIAILGSVLLTSTLERRDRRFVQEALGRYTSPALVRQLVANPELLSLDWGEEREMSVYFSDIAGFTSIAEALGTREIVGLLNEYLTEMTDIVLAHDGVVDKYIGDAIMAFWGAPVPDEKHAERAVRAAIAMRDRCAELRETWRERYGHEVYARAGVNSGLAVVGNMGSEHKYNYTVMGDMVNLASRLEGANKPYGTDLMISESTHQAVADLIESRELDSIAVKGKEQPVRVYEVIRLEESGGEPLTHIRPFEEGLALYREGRFAEAIEALEKALQIRPEDIPSAIFIDRCREFLADPPGENWDGVWRMKEK